jgi:hypothetical protein
MKFEIKNFLLIFILSASMFISGCAVDSIENIKNDDKIGEQVTIRGTVKESVKIGEFSGYLLEDDTASIGIYSDSLPAEGDVVTVKGVLLKDNIFGYYVRVEG